MSKDSVYMEITEQPAQGGVRFRYKCEGRSAGIIKGSTSSDTSKTFPTIKVHGYRGAAVCLVSCVSREGPPYYPHPHNVVGRNTAGNGICCLNIEPANDMVCSFPNLGIQCVKKKDIKESLAQRQKLNVDPFTTGFSHTDGIQTINLNCVRLCFQVFISDCAGKVCVPLRPVVSEPVFDCRVTSDLAITRMSHCSGSVIGGEEIIILCDQVNKDDIDVIFYEEENGRIIWSSSGRFLPHNVHRKVAISFLTPAYRSLHVSKPIRVSLQLCKPSDGASGKPCVFTYLPLNNDPDGTKRKKRKYDLLNLETMSLQRCFDSDPILQTRNIFADQTRQCSDIITDGNYFERNYNSCHSKIMNL